jgi:hypothetical protein
MRAYEGVMMVSEVAIAGAGMIGSYLHRLLELQGISSDIYGQAVSHTSCGINPCAWGATRPFRQHVKAVGMDPEKYILKDFKVVNFENVDMRASLLTFDKPLFIRDLRECADVIEGPVPKGKYERIIDATGAARAYLPPITNDLLVPCVQYRVKADNADSSRVTILYGNLGYSWIFPLSDTEFHIGAGSLLADPRETLRESGFLKPGWKRLCGCSGKVRSTSPLGSRPFIFANPSVECDVWGVGEAIGAVAPIAGEGIVPGMASARLLVASWGSPRRYISRTLKEFSWMIGEKAVIDKVSSGEQLGLQDWLILRRTGRRMGAPVTLRETRELLKCLERTRRSCAQNPPPFATEGAK